MMHSTNDPVTLCGPVYPPAGGKAARRLVILLHGLGADGNDLIGLAPLWGALLPTAEFISPHGPEPCDMAPFGYQWFSLKNREPEIVLAGITNTAPILEKFIDAELAKRGLREENLVLVGFSQGTMMALHVGLRRQRPVAGILGYSGLLAGPQTLAHEIRSRPDVFLIHGEADPVVPVASTPAAEDVLRQVGVPVTSVLRPGLAHGIDEEGVTLGGQFLQNALA